MRIAWCLLLLALGAGAGCVDLPVLLEKPKSVGQPPQPAGPVSADQVTEANASEKAEALRRELDRETAKDGPAEGAKPKILP